MPLRLYMHQDAVTFLVSYFSPKAAPYVPDNLPPPGPPQPPAIFQQLYIAPLAARIDYLPTV